MHEVKHMHLVEKRNFYAESKQIRQILDIADHPIDMTTSSSLVLRKLKTFVLAVVTIEKINHVAKLPMRSDLKGKQWEIQARRRSITHDG